MSRNTKNKPSQTEQTEQIEQSNVSNPSTIIEMNRLPGFETVDLEDPLDDRVEYKSLQKHAQLPPPEN